jgi:hypothetical protein
VLRRVFTDARGNVFLETLLVSTRIGEFSIGRIGQYAILYSSGQLPHTMIRMTKLSADSVSARFHSSVPGGALFTWRLDGGGWSAPEKQARVMLPSLAGGEHKLEVASIDSRLRMDAVPASADFSIGVKPNEQIPAMIARLENARTDDERISAIEALARQPASAVLPALKAARARASGDKLWWIDAAIQEVTQHARQSAPGGNE